MVLLGQSVPRLLSSKQMSKTCCFKALSTALENPRHHIDNVRRQSNLVSCRRRQSSSYPEQLAIQSRSRAERWSTHSLKVGSQCTQSPEADGHSLVIDIQLSALRTTGVTFCPLQILFSNEDKNSQVDRPAVPECAPANHRRCPKRLTRPL